MPKFMILGPVTRDTISRNGLMYHSTGGAVYYQAAVLTQLGIDVTAVITLSKEHKELLNTFPSDVNIIPLYFDKTMEFENIYPNHDLNHRVQRAEVPKNPIKPDDLPDLEGYDAVLLCPLSPFDIPIDTVEFIYGLKIPIYVGVQGYLRYLKDHEVILKPWDDFKKFLPYFKMIFMDQCEARVVIGEGFSELDIEAEKLASFGPEEVIITCGDRGALIYSSISGQSHRINAFPTKQSMDPTGLGDTYMAAYATKRMETKDPETCGLFASMTSTIKLENRGAFKGNREMITERLRRAHQMLE